MTIRLLFAYVKILLALVFFLLVVMLFFSNAGNTCSNLNFFTKTFNNVSLAKLMLVCAATGAASIFMVWILFTGGMTLHRYRKAHPIVKEDQDSQQPETSENLSENE